MTFRIIDQSNSKCYVNKATVANQTRRKISHTHTAVEGVHRRKSQMFIVGKCVQCAPIASSTVVLLYLINWNNWFAFGDERKRCYFAFAIACVLVDVVSVCVHSIRLRRNCYFVGIRLWIPVLDFGWGTLFQTCLAVLSSKSKHWLELVYFVFCHSPNEQLIVRESPLTAHDSHPCWARWCIYAL